MNLTLTAAVLGAFIAGSILMLVRHGHLHGTHAAWWLIAACAALGLGLFPAAVDRVGRVLGVAYPPMLLVVVAIIAVLIKLLITDIELARKERRLRRLTQKLAMLEYELDQARATTTQGGGSMTGSRSAAASDGARRSVG